MTPHVAELTVLVGLTLEKLDALPPMRTEDAVSVLNEAREIVDGDDWRPCEGRHVAFQNIRDAALRYDQRTRAAASQMSADAVADGVRSALTSWASHFGAE